MYEELVRTYKRINVSINQDNEFGEAMCQLVGQLMSHLTGGCVPPTDVNSDGG